ncbi:MAG: hypothetical protein ACUVX8_00050 [Candidatus Zipacnadales bacterium]
MNCLFCLFLEGLGFDLAEAGAGGQVVRQEGWEFLEAGGLFRGL